MYKARAGNLLIFNPKHKSLTILLSYYGDVKDQIKWLLAQLGAFLVQNVTFYGSRDQCTVWNTTAENIQIFYNLVL